MEASQMLCKKTIFMIFSVLVTASILLVPARTAAAGAGGMALMVEASPPQGGSVDPEVGVHRYERPGQVSLKATPKPGYRFVQWMGEVSDPTVSSTFVNLQAPKIVIAVFARSEYELPQEEGPIISAPVGGLIRSGGDFSSTGGVSAAGGIRRGDIDFPPFPEPIEPDDFPVPETPEPDDFPVPQVPEPAAGLLMLYGAAMARWRRS
jgi:hypothetical protein